MHGNIGGRTRQPEAPRDPRAFYDNRAAFLETCRRTGSGGIDYDFYRARARRQRNLVRRKFVRRLTPLVRPLVAVMLLIAVVGVMPTRTQERSVCALTTPPMSAR